MINVQSPSVTWVGTRQGAIRFSRDYQTREYFAGARWLPDDHVTGIGFDRDATWIETPKGFARIDDVPMTLADKSRVFVDRIQARHNRWGLTASSQLRVPGDLSTNQMVSSDNDGLWTAMYVAAECFRYRVTGEADARENARRGMQAIVRLEAITGKSGLSRALVHQDRRGRATGRWRVARYAGQGVALEGRHQLRRNRRTLLRLSGVPRPRRRRGGEAARCARRSNASRTTSWTTTTN